MVVRSLFSLQTLSHYVLVSLLSVSIVYGTSIRSFTIDKLNEVNSPIKSPSTVSQFLTYKDSTLPSSSVLQFLFLKHIRFSPTSGVAYVVSSCWEYSPWVFTSLATFHPSGLKSNVASSRDSLITLSKVVPPSLLHHPIYYFHCTCRFFF